MGEYTTTPIVAIIITDYKRKVNYTRHVEDS